MNVSKQFLQQGCRQLLQLSLFIAILFLVDNAYAAAANDAKVLGDYVDKVIGKQGSARVWVRTLAIAAFIVGCLDSARTFHPRSAIMGLATAFFMVMGYGVITGDYLTTLFTTFGSK
jgi:hypothetical protein